MKLSRRQFTAALGVSAVATAAAPLGADDSKPAPLRVIAYNIYKATGWPKQRSLAKRAVEEKQMAERLAMELALHEPDIINFSESPSEAMTKAVAERLGMHHVRFPSGGHWPGTLLSRYEMTDSENTPMGGERPKDLFTRHWGRATVHVAGRDPLIVHSAHLYPTPDPTVRLKEVRAMIKAMKPDLDAGRSMLLIGDLNHGPDSEEYQLWMDAGWVDTFAQVGEGEGPTIPADTPKHRIDYVLATGPIAQRTSESRPLFEGAFRLNIQDEKSFALSDHLPQLAVFQ